MSIPGPGRGGAPSGRPPIPFHLAVSSPARRRKKDPLFYFRRIAFIAALLCAPFLARPLSGASPPRPGELGEAALAVILLNARKAPKRPGEEAAGKGTAYFKTIFDESPIGIELFDPRGRLMDANRACLEIFGVSRLREVKDFDLFADPNLPEEAKERLRRGKGVHSEITFSFDAVRGKKLYRTEKTGTVYLDVIITPLSDAPGGYLAQIQDVTERKESEDTVQEQQKFLMTVIESLSNPFYVVDVNDYTVKLMNSAARSRGVPGAVTCFSLMQCRKPCPPGQRCPIDEIKRTGRAVIIEQLHHDKEGNPRYYEVHASPIFDEGGAFVQMIEYTVDVTERKRMEEELRALSLIDELTGLYNRRGFMTLAEKELAIARREGEKVLFIFADIDGMKKINDSFGHREGDRALIEINNVLRSTFRESDIIARMGGDEFAVLSLNESKDDAAAILQRLEKNLEHFNEFLKLPYPLSLSAGTAYYDPAFPATIGELLDRADQMMYRQKMGKKKKRKRTLL